MCLCPKKSGQNLNGEEKNMVYCKRLEKTETYAVYSIGTAVEDMTGRVRFYGDLREPELLKQAQGEPVGIRHLAGIYGKYREEFAAGNFREKLAYEIG